jgi:hypothetical protein
MRLTNLLDHGFSKLCDLSPTLIVRALYDTAKSAAESEQLGRILNEPSLVAETEARLREAGSDSANKAISRFDPDQTRTLLANLLALTMPDGEITGPEQDFMENVRLAIEIDPA